MNGAGTEEFRGADHFWLIAGYCAAAVVYYLMRVYSPHRYHYFTTVAWMILEASGELEHQ